MYNEKERKIVFFSFPILIILASYLLTNLAPTHMNDYYVGDEKNIWDAAVRLYPYFFVYTSEIFLICFFIIPTIISPSIIKISFCSLVLGYTVYRTNKYYDTKLSYLIYALCLLKPVCELGIQVHRMQWYAFLYLFFAIKLFFDSKEKKIKFSYTTVILMSCVISILTVLRREGLYLFVLGAAIMVLVYAKDNQVICKKNVIRVLIIFCICEAVIYYPAAKNGFGEKYTTYRAYLVHILGERSLDRSIISEELKIADQYMNIEIIDKYNNDQGIWGFSDCMYDWQGWSDGYYYAIRDEEAVSCDEFADAVFDIIKKEPVVFLKSRARAFAAAARSENSYNLFLPLLITLFLTVYSLKQRDKTLVVLCLGVLVHTGITILTMPASYFKYFYEVSTQS